MVGLIRRPTFEAVLLIYHRKVRMTKPKISNSESEKELVKAQEQFDKFDAEVKSLTLDNMNSVAPQRESEGHKIAQKDIDKSKDIYLKPKRTIPSKEKFNERFRDDYNFATEYVQFISKNNEIISEDIEVWTKPFPGVPAQEWVIPVNKPVWGPRHLAEQIAKCKYHKLTMSQNNVTGADGMGQYYGSMVATETVNRLEANPVSTRKSIFMGAQSF